MLLLHISRSGLCLPAHAARRFSSPPPSRHWSYVNAVCVTGGPGSPLLCCLGNIGSVIHVIFCFINVELSPLLATKAHCKLWRWFVKDDLWRCKCTILLKLYRIYEKIRQEHFLFWAPINSEYSPNPTWGDSPRLQRRAEVRGKEVTPLLGAVSQLSRERTRRTRSVLCRLSSCKKLLSYSLCSQSSCGLLGALCSHCSWDQDSWWNVVPDPLGQFRSPEYCFDGSYVNTIFVVF